MRQRVRALKGEFRVHGRAGAGTTIEVNIPLDPPAQMNQAGAASTPA